MNVIVCVYTFFSFRYMDDFEYDGVPEEDDQVPALTLDDLTPDRLASSTSSLRSDRSDYSRKSSRNSRSSTTRQSSRKEKVGCNIENDYIAYNQFPNSKLFFDFE